MFMGRCLVTMAPVRQSKTYSGHSLSHFPGKRLEKRSSCSLLAQQRYLRLLGAVPAGVPGGDHKIHHFYGNQSPSFQISRDLYRETV